METSVNYQSLPLKCKIKIRNLVYPKGKVLIQFTSLKVSSLSFAKDKGVLKDVITIPHEFTYHVFFFQNKLILLFHLCKVQNFQLQSNLHV